MRILKAGDTGSFEELSSKDNPSSLVVSYNPPIEAMLERAKNLKGESLSPNEIENIRRNAPAIAIPQKVHGAAFGNENK